MEFRNICGPLVLSKLFHWFREDKGLSQSEASWWLDRGVTRVCCVWKHNRRGVWGLPRLPSAGPGQSHGREFRGQSPPAKMDLSNFRHCLEIFSDV